MGHVFCIANQKGGVGKTTTSVNLAAALARRGHRVLLVDLDPQGNATMGSGVDKRTLVRSVYQVLVGLSGLEEATLRSESGGYDVLPANRELAGAEVELVDLPRREFRLRDALAAAPSTYDFVLIDCPPSLSLLTLNALTCAHGVIIPMQCEYYALEGLSDLMTTMRAVKRRLNPTLGIFGVLLTMYDGRTNFSAQVAEEVRRHFPGKVFAAVIPRNVRLSEAPSHGLPIFAYDRFSRGAAAYDALVQEILTKGA